MTTRSGSNAVTLTWHRFGRLTDARRQFADTPCVYVQADSVGRPLRVGKASRGLNARYRGGTGWAIDAAMHGTANVVFVAAVATELVSAVEAVLIWSHRHELPYNNQGKRVQPAVVTLEQRGDIPDWAPPQ